MKILAIIVTYNSMRWIEQCISSLKKSLVKVDILVIDNGSNDDTTNFLTQLKDVTFIQNITNLGFGQANNLGFQYAIDHEYDYIYLINQDAWIYPDTIKILIDEIEKSTEYGILSPMQLANDCSFDSNFLKYTLTQSVELINDSYFGKLRAIYQIPFVMAAHWLIKKECLTIVGGFSPTFFHYGEDENYLQRVNHMGFKVGIATKAKAIHDREDRQITKEKLLFFICYNRYLIRFSSPEVTHLYEWYSMLKNNVKQAIKDKSLLPIQFSIKLFSNYYRIRKNRHLSEKHGAFLHLNHVGVNNNK